MSSNPSDGGSPSGKRPFFAEQEIDDRSTHLHRQLIGLMGLAMPVLLWIIAALRHTPDPTRWQVLDSVSAYYHTGAVAAFVGILGALAAFLITYRGFDNEDNWRDRLAGCIASLAAVGVAFFPTTVPAGYPEPSWWTAPMRTIHYLCAVVLFGCFAVFSLFLFPKSKVEPGKPLPPDKAWRNRVHVTCGVIIVLCMLWAGSTAFTKASIFVPESIALWSFAVSWLTKGRADWTMSAAAERAALYGRRPSEIAVDVKHVFSGGRGRNAP